MTEEKFKLVPDSDLLFDWEFPDADFAYLKTRSFCVAILDGVTSISHTGQMTPAKASGLRDVTWDILKITEAQERLTWSRTK